MDVDTQTVCWIDLESPDRQDDFDGLVCCCLRAILRLAPTVAGRDEANEMDGLETSIRTRVMSYPLPLYLSIELVDYALHIYLRGSPLCRSRISSMAALAESSYDKFSSNFTIGFPTPALGKQFRPCNSHTRLAKRMDISNDGNGGVSSRYCGASVDFATNSCNDLTGHQLSLPSAGPEMRTVLSRHRLAAAVSMVLH